MDVEFLVKCLEDMARQEDQIEENNRSVVDMLRPEWQRFEAKTGHNVYAARMYVDHLNEMKRANKRAEVFEAAVDFIKKNS